MATRLARRCPRSRDRAVPAARGRRTRTRRRPPPGAPRCGATTPSPSAAWPAVSTWRTSSSDPASHSAPRPGSSRAPERDDSALHGLARPWSPRRPQHRSPAARSRRHAGARRPRGCALARIERARAGPGLEDRAPRGRAARRWLPPGPCRARGARAASAAGPRRPPRASRRARRAQAAPEARSTAPGRRARASPRPRLPCPRVPPWPPGQPSRERSPDRRAPPRTSRDEGCGARPEDRIPRPPRDRNGRRHLPRRSAAPPRAERRRSPAHRGHARWPARAAWYEARRCPR